LEQLIVGRVLASKDRPASSTEFYVSILKPEYVEVGTYVIVEDQCRILGVVEDIEYSTQALSEDSYTEAVIKSRGVQTYAQQLTYIYAKIRVLERECEIKRPPKVDSLVRVVTEKDKELIARKIPETKRVVLGFIRSSVNEKSSTFVPVYGHIDYICGPEAAHVNISGQTGMATKTSYALFLAYSMLAQSAKSGEKIAVVMFNVKRGDLLRLHMIPRNNDELKEYLKKLIDKIGGDERIYYENIEMWKRAIEEGIKPWEYKVKYFTYSDDPYLKSYLKEHPHVITYKYGLGDLSIEEIIAALYGPGEEWAERQIGTLYTYFDNASATGLYRDKLTFKDVLNDFGIFKKYFNRQAYDAAIKSGRTSPAVVELDDWHQATVSAIYRKLKAFLSQAKNVIDADKAHSNPIEWGHIEPNTIHVIQLYGLSDAEKRVVVNAVLRVLSEGLENRSGNVERVLVIADELNKYAPKRASPIKEQLIDIAARGRDLRLSLVGIQQFASEIDEEIYGNCSTKVVGRSDVAEISSDIYRYLGDLRKICPALEKGEVIVAHPLYSAPLILRFPIPLHLTD